MPQFNYQAEDGGGERTSGQISANTSDDARDRLASRGLSAINVTPVESIAPTGRLTPAEAEQVLGQISDLSSAAAPLADGLRAAAAESVSFKVASTLRAIAAQLERGTPLEHVLSDRQATLPGYVQGLVAASVRTGRIGLALEELIDHHRDTRAIWWGVVAAVTYPLIVLGLAVAMLVLFSVYTVPPFKALFDDFELELPMVTQLLIRTSDLLMWFCESGAWLVAIGGGLLGITLFLLATGWGGGALQRFLATVPFAGSLWHWSGTAAGTRLLAILLDHGVPLPEALRLAGAGVRNGNVRETLIELAAGVEGGARLSELLASRSHLPSSLVPLVRWGERTGQLAEALRDASELYVVRIRIRAQLLRSVSPALVFILVFLMVGFAIVALFMPLVDLIQALV